MTQAGRLTVLAKRAGAFLIVGGIAFFVDALVFNVLVFGVALAGDGPFSDAPLVAKALAIAAATVVTYVGNRYWTFGARRLERRLSRYAIFVVLNVVAVGLQLACLGFSRYVLSLEGIVADNVSGTIVGQCLATLFRFYTYDRWVFRERPSAASRAAKVSETIPRRTDPSEPASTAGRSSQPRA